MKKLNLSSYDQIINWIFNRLPVYQNQGETAYNGKLNNITNLCNYLKNPQQKIKTIHIGGTNGKGSTSHMLASILQEAGYKVGLYTSPHLKDFRERIRINGQKISKKFIVNFITKNKSKFEELQLSFFEMTVGMAFYFFAKNKIDIAIIEVGLGGRLDATNIIRPEVSVVTNIGKDHTQFLGNTLQKIAIEKAGIIKKNIPIVIGETQKGVKKIFIDFAKKNDAQIYFADQLIHENYSSDLQGNYQIKNQKTVLQTLKVIQKKGFSVFQNHIENGFLNVIENTSLQGRWQKLSNKPLTYCDTAHNKEGLQIVLKQLQSLPYKKLHIILGFVKDKNINEILTLFPKEGVYYFCNLNIDRGLNVEELQKKGNQLGLKGEIYHSVQQAYSFVKKKASNKDVIFLGGSTFLIAEIL